MVWPFAKKRDVIDMTPFRNRVKQAPGDVDLTANPVNSATDSSSNSADSALGFLGAIASNTEPSPAVISESLQNQDMKVKIDDMSYKMDSLSRRINSLIDRIDLVEKKVDRNQRLGN